MQQKLILQKSQSTIWFYKSIALGVTLVFRVFYVDHEDTTIVLRDPKFKIEVVSSTSFSVLTRYVHPLIIYNQNNWNLTFSVQNPNNNYDFYYNDFKANISYTDTLLWSANVFDKFHQDAKDQSLIDSTFAALPEAYEYWIGTSIAGDFVSGQTTRFSVSLSGKIQISDPKSPSHTIPIAQEHIHSYPGSFDCLCLFYKIEEFVG
ncbi:hypothetical protein RDI58_021746 [Solanum bulbocastanum]|uniref:Late embryogenesis abundant protein LEA-2 subgroup domain-containing protein n=1 Tax=Solanum bulbocastanum TaxID=147425 RepID=A0AAN8Y568_SOLBU